MLVILVEKTSSDSQFSFTFLFVLQSLLSLLFTSRYTMEAFLNFFILLFDSSVFAKHSVISQYNTACDVSYAIPRLIRFC